MKNEIAEVKKSIKKKNPELTDEQISYLVNFFSTAAFIRLEGKDKRFTKPGYYNLKRKIKEDFKEDSQINNILKQYDIYLNSIISDCFMPLTKGEELAKTDEKTKSLVLSACSFVESDDLTPQEKVETALLEGKMSKLQVQIADFMYKASVDTDRSHLDLSKNLADVIVEINNKLELMGLSKELTQKLQKDSKSRYLLLKFGTSFLEKHLEELQIEQQIATLEKMYGSELKSKDKDVYLYRINNGKVDGDIKAKGEDSDVAYDFDHISKGSSSKNYQSPYISTTSDPSIAATYMYTNERDKTKRRFNIKAVPYIIDITKIYEMLKNRQKELKDPKMIFEGEKDLFYYLAFEKDIQTEGIEKTVYSLPEDEKDAIVYKKDENLPEAILDKRAYYRKDGKIQGGITKQDKKNQIRYFMQIEDENIFKGKTEDEINKILDEKLESGDFSSLIKKLEDSAKFAQPSAEILFKKIIPKEAVKEVEPLAFDILSSVGNLGKEDIVVEKIFDKNFKFTDFILEKNILAPEELEFVKKFYLEKTDDISTEKETDLKLSAIRNTIVNKTYEELVKEEKGLKNFKSNLRVIEADDKRTLSPKNTDFLVKSDNNKVGGQIRKEVGSKAVKKRAVKYEDHKIYVDKLSYNSKSQKVKANLQFVDDAESPILPPEIMQIQDINSEIFVDASVAAESLQNTKKVHIKLKKVRDRSKVKEKDKQVTIENSKDESEKER